GTLTKTRHNVANRRADTAQTYQHYILPALFFTPPEFPRASQTLQIDPPDIPLPQIGEPQAPVPDPHRIAARAYPLLDHRIAHGVDLGQRNLEDGRPHVAIAERQFAARAGEADFDIRHQLARLHIDARHGTVALIECPHRARAY